MFPLMHGKGYTTSNGVLRPVGYCPTVWHRFTVWRQTRFFKFVHARYFFFSKTATDNFLAKIYIPSGHANCVKFVKSFNKPLLLLGGGGYTMRNVSRAWAFETGLAAGVELGPGMFLLRAFGRMAFTESEILEIPVNEYYEYFGPDYELDVKSSNMDDMNTPGYLERVRGIVLDNLRHLGGPPSVQMSGAFISLLTSLLSWI